MMAWPCTIRQPHGKEGRKIVTHTFTQRQTPSPRVPNEEALLAAGSASTTTAGDTHLYTAFYTPRQSARLHYTKKQWKAKTTTKKKKEEKGM